MTLQRTQITLLLFLALLICSAMARADEIVTWNREPIQVTLVVNEERRLDFPDDVRVGIPVEIADPAKFRTQSLSGSVYWKALKPFATQRIYATLVQSGHIVVFDVTAREHAAADNAQPSAPIKIEFPEGVLTGAPDVATGISGNTTNPDATVTTAIDQPISAIALSRFAAQQLYAPTRLLVTVPGVERVPMHIASELPQLYAGGGLQLEPLASWRGGELFVTAVKMRNLTKEFINLDPRKLRGRLLHATFQHRSLRLGPVGSITDTTTVYLITDRPFIEVVTMGACHGSRC